MTHAGNETLRGYSLERYSSEEGFVGGEWNPCRSRGSAKAHSPTEEVYQSLGSAWSFIKGCSPNEGGSQLGERVLRREGSSSRTRVNGGGRSLMGTPDALRVKRDDGSFFGGGRAFMSNRGPTTIFESVV